MYEEYEAGKETKEITEKKKTYKELKKDSRGKSKIRDILGKLHTSVTVIKACPNGVKVAGIATILIFGSVGFLLGRATGR
jgi:hypothetical protein